MIHGMTNIFHFFYPFIELLQVSFSPLWFHVTLWCRNQHSIEYHVFARVTDIGFAFHFIVFVGCVIFLLHDKESTYWHSSHSRLLMLYKIVLPLTILAIVCVYLIFGVKATTLFPILFIYVSIYITYNRK